MELTPEKCVTIINIFVKHYNMYNDATVNMFCGIDTLDGSNDIMEEFYEHLDDYKNSADDDKQIFAPNEILFDDFEKLFGLKINENIICVCSLMFPLLNYIAEHVDWTHTKWMIVPLKME